MAPAFEVIDALIDGERVDASALKAALADPAGRDYLVDAWILREAAQDEIAVDGPVPLSRRRPRPIRTWMFAAALVVCVLSGYFVGYRFAGSARGAATSSPSLSSASPATSAATSGRAAAPPSAFPMPEPTRVIQVQFDTDRASAAGGH